jgi:anti-sigma factor RsiW
MTPPVDDFPCNRFVELVTEYLDGALSADDTGRLEEHLAACGGCESVLDQFRVVIRTSGALREHDVTVLAPDARASIMTAFREWASTRPGS